MAWLVPMTRSVALGPTGQQWTDVTQCVGPGRGGAGRCIGWQVIALAKGVGVSLLARAASDPTHVAAAAEWSGGVLRRLSRLFLAPFSSASQRGHGVGSRVGLIRTAGHSAQSFQDVLLSKRSHPLRAYI